jgi:DNA repair photolyase
MIKDIHAKVMLNHIPQPDTWFGLKYTMNLYRGCQHQCIYCDSRSDCYQIENFRDILVKTNAIDLLRDELARKRIKGTIGTGSMNDPYMPIEKKRELTRRALEVIAEQRFPVHVLTKSDLVLRDLEILQRISQIYTAVSFTITTADDELGKKLEPGASLVSDRFRAIKAFADEGIYTGVIMTPILPFLEDNEENITQIVRLAHEHGASYIIPAFGMTLRTGSRDYYYEKLDLLFPGVRQKYERKFGEKYQCSANNARKLDRLFRDLCGEHGIATAITPFKPISGKQLDLW